MPTGSANEFQIDVDFHQGSALTLFFLTVSLDVERYVDRRNRSAECNGIECSSGIIPHAT